MIRFWKKTSQPAHFIEKPIYDPKKVFLTDLHELIHMKPLTLPYFASQHIVDRGPALTKLAATAVNEAVVRLYAVPLVRQYYGDDFVHGVRARANDPLVEFYNIDDTDQAMQFLKELTIIVEKMLYEALRVFNLYILFHGESFEFITEKEKSQIKNHFYDDRIVWTE